jgi:hypothetical protein
VSAPYLHVGLYDPGRDGAALREAARVHLMLGGAEVERSDGVWEVSSGTPLAAGGRDAWLEVLPVDDGGLVDVVVELGDLVLGPPASRHDLLLAALDLVAGVRPVLATLAVEEPPDGLPDPGWPEASTLLVAGWVDPARAGAARRLRFDRLAEAGVAVPYADGLAWGLDDAVRPGEQSRTAGAPPWVVAAAVYEAWTGREAELPQPVPPPRPEDDPAAAIPQLWWWSQDEDPDAVRERVEAALPDGVESWVDPSGDPGWQAVITNLGRGRAAAGLDLLRDAVAAVRPSWAAVQPAGGLAVPGMDPSLPMTGVLANPWVSRDWAGAELPELDDALAGTHREEFGDGVLWVTDPRLADLPDESWADDDVRWDRLVAVAAILSRIAHGAGRPTA